MKNAIWMIGFTAVAVAVCFVQPAAAQQRTQAPPEFINWLPITDAERQLKTPAVEKDAGAEILLWRVHVVDEYQGQDLQRVFYHYIRLKVFDAKGKEKTGTVDLPYREPGGILEVAGRTIKPDGTILELDRKTVYKRDLVRAGGRASKVVSFAMPGVDDGAILEYRWKQTQNDNRFRFLRLEFTRDLPVQKVTYFLKPLSSDYVATDLMYLLPFNCKPTPLEVDRDRWTETTLVNIAADRDEPYTPSDPNIKPWALLYYREGKLESEKYWNDQAKKTYNDFKGLLKADNDLKSAVTQAIASAKTDEDKMTVLIGYLRKRVRSFFDSDVTDAERDDFIKKLPNDRERNSSEILKSGMALPNEMSVLLGAFATQAGMDVRPVLVANKDSEIVIDPRSLPEKYFLDDMDIGVKSGDSWKLFSVSNKYLAPALIPSGQEGTFAVVSDPKAAIFMRVQISPPELSMEKRSAKLKLTADGTLIGDVDESYSGYRAETYRSRFARQSAAQREESVRDRVVRMFPSAEMTDLKIENIEDAAKPIRIVYHLEAPLFAQVTGKRILFHPNAFRRAQSAPFTASERRYPVEFPNAWKELDELSIDLPSGFVLESPENPGSFDFGEPGSYKLTMNVKNGDNAQLSVARELTFGAKGRLLFDVSVYPTLKKIFDEIQLRDTHTLSLRGN